MSPVCRLHTQTKSIPAADRRSMNNEIVGRLERAFETSKGASKDESINFFIPTKVAVVLANFQTRVGSRVLMTLTHLGSLVPFGANMTLLEAEAKSAAPNSAMVGLNAEVYLSGMPERGRLQMQWGTTANQKCESDFTLPAGDGASVRIANIDCL